MGFLETPKNDGKKFQTLGAVLCCIVFLAFSAYPAAGQQGHSVALDFRTGFLYGTSYELVYEADWNSQYVSELQWDIKPLWFAGLSVKYGYGIQEFSHTIVFYTALGVKLGFPMKTGAMEDRDWLTPTTTPGSLTFFSSHENHTKSAIISDWEAGISLPLVTNLSIDLYLGLSYMYFKFEGWNGFTQYGANNHIATQSNPYVPWDSSWPKDNINGLGIDYTQHWIIARGGVDFILDTDYFKVKVGVSLSPKVGCIAIDNHHKRVPRIQATSGLSGTFYVEPEAEFLYKFNDRFSIGLSFSYRYIDVVRGNLEQDEYFSTGTKTTSYQDISGAAYKAFTGEVVFRTSFRKRTHT